MECGAYSWGWPLACCAVPRTRLRLRTGSWCTSPSSSSQLIGVARTTRALRSCATAIVDLHAARIVPMASSSLGAIFGCRCDRPLRALFASAALARRRAIAARLELA